MSNQNGMMQVYSLPNLEVKEKKPDTQWILYQNDGTRLAAGLMLRRLASRQE
jgi:hypothetical protein